MNALQILGLITFIVVSAGALGYLFQSGKDEEEEPTFIIPEYTKEELENIKAAEQAYNEPVVTEELNIIEPELLTQETPEPTKPANKKRKYYPKKKKQ